MEATISENTVNIGRNWANFLGCPGSRVDLRTGEQIPILKWLDHFFSVNIKSNRSGSRVKELHSRRFLRYSNEQRCGQSGSLCCGHVIPDGILYEVCAALSAEYLHNPVLVKCHRSRRHVQDLADFLHRFSLGE